MTITLDKISTVNGSELAALAARLQAEPAQQRVILTLAATGDAAAAERGFAGGLRAALETAAEPPPADIRHVWGDWPHDLFAALKPYTAGLAGRAVALHVWPDGRCEAFACEAPVRATSYFLVQPVTFPLVEAAAALRPAVAVELHRDHAAIRVLEGSHETATSTIHVDRDSRVKTGIRALKHAERHDEHVEASYFDEVAAEALRMATPGSTVVVLGATDARQRFMPHLAQTLTTAELDLDPDPARRASPDDVHAAAANALDASQAAALEAANQTARAVTDWQAIAHAAQDGQLHEVWIDAGAALHDYICNHCGSRVAGPDACAACQASPWERLPLPEYVLREATRTGATVHFVSGAAAAALAQGTGAVGTLRY